MDAARVRVGGRRADLEPAGAPLSGLALLRCDGRGLRDARRQGRGLFLCPFPRRFLVNALLDELLEEGLFELGPETIRGLDARRRFGRGLLLRFLDLARDLVLGALLLLDDDAQRVLRGRRRRREVLDGQLDLLGVRQARLGRLLEDGFIVVGLLLVVRQELPESNLEELIHEGAHGAHLFEVERVVVKNAALCVREAPVAI